MLVTTKAHEGDLVELTEDLPKYGLKRGQRGFVIEAFDKPNEAYDIEFEDEEGEFLGFAYSVKPDQIRGTDEILKEEYEHGMKLLNEGKTLEAERAFKKAVDLNPECLGNLHNSILEFYESAAKGVGSLEELWGLIAGLRFILRINPKFETARHNMAVVYLNYGYEQAIRGNIDTALDFYTLAIAIDSPPEFISCLKNNFASAYTLLSIQAQQKGDLKNALKHSIKACTISPDEVTRSNLGAAYANLGRMYLDNGDYKTAIELLQRAQDTGLRAPELFNNYGVALAAIGHLYEAMRKFEKALELSPKDKRAADNLAAMKKVIMNLAKPDEFSIKASNFIPISPVQAYMSPIQPYQVAA